MNSRRAAPHPADTAVTTHEGEQPASLETKIATADIPTLLVAFTFHVANRETTEYYRTGRQPKALYGADPRLLEVDMLSAILEAGAYDDTPFSVLHRAIKDKYTALNIRAQGRRSAKRGAPLDGVMPRRVKPILFHDELPAVIELKQQMNDGTIKARRQQEVKTYLLGYNAFLRDVVEDGVIEPIIAPYQRDDSHLPFEWLDVEVFERFSAPSYMESRTNQAPLTDALTILPGKEPLVSFLMSERAALGLK